MGPAIGSKVDKKGRPWVVLIVVLLFGCLAYINEAKDGGTIGSTISALEALKPLDSNVLVTITVGGNDLLAGLSDRSNFPDPWLAQFEKNLNHLLTLTLKKYPSAKVLVGNIYDVTDGTGIAQTRSWEAREFLPVLGAVNRIISRLAIDHGAFIDINRHFRGHTVRFDDSTYEHYEPTDPSCWICLDIEPNARGSSEIRRLFWEAASVG